MLVSGPWVIGSVSGDLMTSADLSAPATFPVEIALEQAHNDLNSPAGTGVFLLSSAAEGWVVHGTNYYSFFLSKSGPHATETASSSWPSLLSNGKPRRPAILSLWGTLCPSGLPTTPSKRVPPGGACHPSNFPYAAPARGSPLASLPHPVAAPGTAPRSAWQPRVGTSAPRLLPGLQHMLQWGEAGSSQARDALVAQ